MQSGQTLHCLLETSIRSNFHYDILQSMLKLRMLKFSSFTLILRQQMKEKMNCIMSKYVCAGSEQPMHPAEMEENACA